MMFTKFLLLVCAAFALQHAPAGAIDQPFVDHSKWCVSSFEGGIVPGFHPVPWTFESDGHVAAGNLWTAKWESTGNSTVRMITEGAPDIIVQFVSTRIFIGWKNHATFRWGVRTEDNSCPSAMSN